ncbi:MAG: YtxH-like protein [Syntrophorhabdus sp. PtaU1.Bin153]|nr:MAG: YtxH-like protein [Syntrophorhabdus sp. PtaU1.Bin153]
MGNEKGCSGICCVLSFLTGAVVGGGIALLTAPKSGKRTREQLMRLARDTRGKAEDYYDEMKDKAAEATEKIQDFCQEISKAIESTVDTAKKTLDRGQK